MSSSIASFVLRRTFSRTFLPICKPRCYSSLAFSSPLVPRVLTGQALTKALPAISIRFASSASAKLASSDDKIKRADENLLRVLDSEIECAEDPEDGYQEAVLPNDSPFEIIDNPGDQSIILKREFQGENIQVTVYSNFEEEEEGEDNDEGSDEDEDSNASQQTISLVVTINKGAGPTLEFCCNLDSDNLEIESLALKRPEDASDDGAYQGPEFSDLDESLQKAFRKYLAARGIKGSLHGFLHGYMMTKEDREYIVWLKNLKEFVAK